MMDFFARLFPIFMLVMGIGIALVAAKFIFEFGTELHELQHGRLNPPEKPKNQPIPDAEYISEPILMDHGYPLISVMKRKPDQPDLGQVVGIGEDGELIYGDEPIEEDDEPRYTR